MRPLDLTNWHPRGPTFVLGRDLRACNNKAIELSQLVAGSGLWVNFGNDLHRTEIDRLWVELILPEKLIFITTMNPWAVSLMGFETVEDVQSSFIFVSDECAATVFSEEDAQDFLSAYTAGIQYVAEILYVKGYW